MTTLYEIRDRIVDVYRRFDYIFRPIFKFILALLLLVEISRNLGFMERLNNYLLIVIIALACTLMPMSMMAAVLALVILLHLYALSLEAAALGAAIFLIIFLIFFRFAPHSAVILLLMPLAMTMDLQYAVPLAAGLLFTVGACVPTALGVVVWEYLHLVIEHRNWLRGASDVEQLLKNFRFLVDNMVHNRGMWVMAGTLAATVLVVYFIRRLAVAYSWLIASAAGILTEILILVYAESHYGVSADIARNIPWFLVSLLIAMIITIFVHNVDFTRMENVQFADDDYYYFVKAVPRVSMEAPDRKASDFYHEAAQRDIFESGTEEITEEEKALAGATTVFSAMTQRKAGKKREEVRQEAARKEEARQEKLRRQEAEREAARREKDEQEAARREKAEQEAVSQAAEVQEPAGQEPDIREESAVVTEEPAAAAEEAAAVEKEAAAVAEAAGASEAQTGTGPAEELSLMDKVRNFLDAWSRTGAGARVDEPEEEEGPAEKNPGMKEPGAEEPGEDDDTTVTAEITEDSPEEEPPAAEDDDDILPEPEMAPGAVGENGIDAETDALSRELARELSRELDL